MTIKINTSRKEGYKTNEMQIFISFGKNGTEKELYLSSHIHFILHLQKKTTQVEGRKGAHHSTTLPGIREYILSLNIHLL